MQINFEKYIEAVNNAEDVSEILQHVRMVEQEINAGGDVGITMENLMKIRDAALARSDVIQEASRQKLDDANHRLELMRQAATLDPDVVTVDLLRGVDGHCAWVRDDYLSMRGICGGERPKLSKFLDRVAEVKAQARAVGVVFKS